MLSSLSVLVLPSLSFVLSGARVRFKFCVCCVCVIGRTVGLLFRLLRCALVFFAEWGVCVRVSQPRLVRLLCVVIVIVLCMLGRAVAHGVGGAALS